MQANEVALRRWVLKLLSLRAEDQQAIKAGLSTAENQQLNALLEQAEALGLSKDPAMIEEMLSTDGVQYDQYAVILNAIVGKMPPVWYALLDGKLLSDQGLAKQSDYYEKYCLYKQKFANYQLAPAMQASLQTYFQEKVINVSNK
jgi:hypothetical protein